MKETLKKQFMENIQPQHLMLSEIPSTIGRSYEKGYDDATAVWKEAIIMWCSENDTPLSQVFPRLYSNIKRIKEGPNLDEIIG